MSSERYNNQFKCLICYSSDDDHKGENLPDCQQIEAVINKNDEFNQAEKGFGLVCKLLTSNVMVQPEDMVRKLTELEQVVFGGKPATETVVRDHHDDDSGGNRGSILICQSCTKILAEILNLEKQIEMLKTMQLDQSDIVKGLLLKTGQQVATTGVSSTFWENTRRQLLECLRRREVPMVSEKTDSVIDGSSNMTSKRRKQNLYGLKKRPIPAQSSSLVGMPAVSTEKCGNLIRPCSIYLTRLVMHNKRSGKSVPAFSNPCPPEMRRSSNNSDQCNESEPLETEVKQEIMDDADTYDDGFDDASSLHKEATNSTITNPSSCETVPGFNNGSNGSKDSDQNNDCGTTVSPDQFHDRPVRQSKVRAVDFIRKALSNEGEEIPQAINNTSKKRKLKMDTSEDDDDQSHDVQYSPPHSHSHTVESEDLEKTSYIPESKTRKTKKKLKKSSTNDTESSEEIEEDEFHDSSRIKIMYRHKADGPNKKHAVYAIRRFIFVTNSTVLYRETILSVEDNGSRIRCQEPGCQLSFTVDPMDFFQLFHQAKLHVDNCHSQYFSKFSKILLTCPVCSVEVQGRKKLRQHLIQVHGGRKLDRKDKNLFNTSYGVCEACMKPVCRIDGNLNRHVWTHLNYQEKMVEAAKVNGCKKPETPAEIEALVDKRNKQLDMTAIKCPTCSKIFSSRRHLQQHLLTHQEKRKTWICEECGKHFLSNGALRTHVNRLHVPISERQNLVCPEPGCGKVFFVRDSIHFREHVKRHRGDTTLYMCDLCGKEYRDKYKLNAHRKASHLDLGKFECDQCGQKFSRKTHFKRHKMRRHGNTL